MRTQRYLQIRPPRLLHDAYFPLGDVALSLVSYFSVPCVRSGSIHGYSCKTILASSFLASMSSSKAFFSGGLSRVRAEPCEMERGRNAAKETWIVFLRILNFLIGKM